MATGSTPAAQGSSFWAKHRIFETNTLWLLIGITIVISIGGLVEIVPLFFIKSTIEEVQGVRPYSPLELAGFNIYRREGCYLCHSQMVRPLRDEAVRYGHYSLAAESMYDHPFQWGSKRTGPDIARLGGKYTDDWHRDHLRDPRSVVSASIMPAYGFLEKRPLKEQYMAQYMKTLRIVGVPYTDEMIANAENDLKAQVGADAKAFDALAQRYPKIVSHAATGPEGVPTEADALIAYLQRLGTLVDFKQYNDKADLR